MLGARPSGPSAVRPPEIEDRLMPGHWEGDLIKGKANASALSTLVERTSGYLQYLPKGTNLSVHS